MSALGTFSEPLCTSRVQFYPQGFKLACIGAAPRHRTNVGASGRLPFKSVLGTRAVVGMCLPVCFSCKPLARFQEDLEFLLGPEKRATRILINFQNVFGICSCKYFKIFLVGPLRIRLDM